jgi:uncharacterized protein YpmS
MRVQRYQKIVKNDQKQQKFDNKYLQSIHHLYQKHPFSIGIGVGVATSIIFTFSTIIGLIIIVGVTSVPAASFTHIQGGTITITMETTAFDSLLRAQLKKNQKQSLITISDSHIVSKNGAHIDLYLFVSTPFGKNVTLMASIEPSKNENGVIGLHIVNMELGGYAIPGISTFLENAINHALSNVNLSQNNQNLAYQLVDFTTTEKSLTITARIAET